MGVLSWNEHFDYGQAMLGLTPEEAQEYAHRKVLEEPVDAAPAVCLVCSSTVGGECEWCHDPKLVAASRAKVA
jgi:hypothetical protein